MAASLLLLVAGLAASLPPALGAAVCSDDEPLATAAVCVEAELADGGTAFTVSLYVEGDQVDTFSADANGTGDGNSTRCVSHEACEYCTVLNQVTFGAAVSRLCASVSRDCPLADPHRFDLECVLADSSGTSREDLPQLPDQWSAVIEANIREKNYSLEMREFFDRAAGVIRQELHHGSDTVLHITDASRGMFAEIVGDNCTVRPVADAPFGVSRAIGADGRLRSARDMFEDFAGSNNYTYEGASTARNIECDHWSQIQSHTFERHDGGGTAAIVYTLTWHFAQPDWVWRHRADHRLPVRADLTGAEYNVSESGEWTRTANFTHVYDFVDFTPGRPDPDLMRVPDSASCALLEQRPVPELPPNFRVAVEGTSSTRNATRSMVEYYDYTENRMRLEMGLDDRGLEHVRLVDGEGGRVYNVFYSPDGKVSSCDESKLDANEFRRVYDPRTHHLRRFSPGHEASPLTGTVPDYRYVGTRVERGAIDVDVWVADFVNVEFDGGDFGRLTLNFTQHLAYAAQGWTLQGNAVAALVSSRVKGTWHLSAASPANATEFEDVTHYFDVDVSEPPAAAFRVPSECPGGPSSSSSTFTKGGVAGLSIFTAIVGAIIGSVFFHRRTRKPRFRLGGDGDDSSTSATH